MPKSWWGKTIVLLYVIGYFLYVGAAGFSTWNQLDFGDWRNYMAWQVAIYGPFWPVLLLIELVRSLN